MITFSAVLWIWAAERGSWHFVTVPEEASAELKLEAAAIGSRSGFGSVRVVAAIGEVHWRTSAFPQKSGTYVLPIKADVRRHAQIVAGDLVTISLESA